MSHFLSSFSFSFSKESINSWTKEWSFVILIISIPLILISAFILGLIYFIYCLYEFIKIFSSLEKGNVFSKIIANRFLITSICSIIIGIIYGINVFVTQIKNSNFEYSAVIVYLFFSIITSMIFLILGIGLTILREIYKTAIKNKEENDLTI